MKCRWVFLTVLYVSLMTSCSSKEERSDVLDRRARYYKPEPSFGKSLESLHRSEMTRPKSIRVWVHGYKLPSGDYFQGSEIRIHIDDFGIAPNQHVRRRTIKRGRRRKPAQRGKVKRRQRASLRVERGRNHGQGAL